MFIAARFILIPLLAVAAPTFLRVAVRAPDVDFLGDMSSTADSLDAKHMTDTDQSGAVDTKKEIRSQPLLEFTQR